MADDFRQNPGRERAVTDSILRPPVQAPFDLLDDGIRAIPEMIEQRRSEQFDADLQRDLRRMADDAAIAMRSAELTADQAADYRAEVQGTIDNLEQHLAGINREENPEQWERTQAVLNAWYQIRAQIPVGLTPEDVRTGRQAGVVGRVMADAQPLGQETAAVGAATAEAARRTAEAREEALTERQYEYMAGEAMLDREHVLALTDFQQTWQGDQNELDRFTQTMMQGLEFENQAARDEFAAQLQKDLQAGEFSQEWLLRQDANAEADRNRNFNLQMSLDLIEAQGNVDQVLQAERLNSAEELEAARLALGWYEAETGAEVARGHLQVAMRAQDLDEDGEYVQSMVAAVESFGGDPDNPMVDTILGLVAADYGEDSPQYRRVNAAAIGIASEHAKLGLQRARFEVDGLELANENAERVNELLGLQIDAQEMLNVQNEWQHNRNIQLAFRGDNEALWGVIFEAEQSGDIHTLQGLQSARNNPLMAEAMYGEGASMILAGVPDETFTEAIAEANAVRTEQGPTLRDRAQTTFDQVTEQNQLNIDQGGVEYWAAVENHAFSVAGTLVTADDLENYILSMGRPSNADELRRMGGTSYLNAVRAAWSRQQSMIGLSDQQAAATLFLENVEDSDTWGDGAYRALEIKYPNTLTEDEKWELITLWRNQRGLSNELQMLDIMDRLAQDDLGGMEPSTLNSIINNYQTGELARINSRFADCAPVTTYEGQGVREYNGAACTRERRDEYTSEMRALEGRVQDLYSSLLGNIARSPFTNEWLATLDPDSPARAAAQYIVDGNYPPEARAAAFDAFFDTYWDDAWSNENLFLAPSEGGDPIPVTEVMERVFENEFDRALMAAHFGGSYFFPEFVFVDRNGVAQRGSGEQVESRANINAFDSFVDRLIESPQVGGVHNFIGAAGSAMGLAIAEAVGIGSRSEPDAEGTVRDAGGNIVPDPAALGADGLPGESVPQIGAGWWNGIGNVVNESFRSWGLRGGLTPGQLYDEATEEATDGGVTAGAPHHGIDFVVDGGVGAPIPNFFSGAVGILDSGWSDSLGWWILIENQATGDTFTFGHLDRDHEEFRGMRVPPGGTVGYQGSTGASTGPHVDWQWWSGPGNTRAGKTQMSTGNGNTTLQEITEVYARNVLMRGGS